MIRVLQITGALNMGGAETMLMNVFRYIDHDKCQFDFVVSGKEIGFYEAEAVKLGAHIYHIKKRSESFCGNLIELYRVIKRNNYKIIHFHTQNAFFTTTQVFIARLAGAKKIIVHSHNTTDWRTGLAKKLHFVFRPLLSQIVDTKLSCGVAAAKWLYGSEKDVKVVPLPVICEKYFFDDLRYNKLRKEYGFSDCIIYTHVGRFSDQKNHEFLLDIFYKIYINNANSILFLVGDGELRNVIEHKINELGLSKNVVLWGNITDVNEKLIMSDVFLFPSLYEGFPTVVLEAQAAGLPCVISDTITKDIAITDLVKFVSIDKNPDLWLSALCEIDCCNEKMRQESNAIVAKNYDITKVAKEFENIYCCEN